jgi:hypothetical protein
VPTEPLTLFHEAASSASVLSFQIAPFIEPIDDDRFQECVSAGTSQSLAAFCNATLMKGLSHTAVVSYRSSAHLVVRCQRMIPTARGACPPWHRILVEASCQHLSTRSPEAHARTKPFLVFPCFRAGRVRPHMTPAPVIAIAGDAEARPCPTHRYFRPRGCCRLRLFACHRR